MRVVGHADPHKVSYRRNAEDGVPYKVKRMARRVVAPYGFAVFAAPPQFKCP